MNIKAQEKLPKVHKTRAGKTPSPTPTPGLLDFEHTGTVEKNTHHNAPIQLSAKPGNQILS